MTDLAEYQRFLEAKVRIDRSTGFEVEDSELNPLLKPVSRAFVRWMLRGGRRALFARFGLHKTVAQLEFMRVIGRRSPRYRLITLPLGVRQEFRLDAKEWFQGEQAIETKFIRNTAELEHEGIIYLTNYESIREGILDVTRFGAISLDEAQILRSFGSKTFGEFLFGPVMDIEYRAVATATPDPNEYLELIAYAHFLGIMDMGEAKTRFFKRNSEKADQLTLRAHKEEEFWLWVSSWALFVQKPSDLGFSDDGYVMPELDVRWHELPSDHRDAGSDRSGQGRMFKNAALGVTEAAKEKRESLDIRVAKLLALRAEHPDAHRLIWHDLEAERGAIETAIPEAATIYGSQDLDAREKILFDFRNGDIAELAAKPVMLGAGGNLQRHCWWEIFLGIGHKFNDVIQAIHRLQRFGQPHQVRVDFIYTEAEREIRRSFEAKWARFEAQSARMSEIIQKFGLADINLVHALTRSMGVERQEASGENWKFVHNDAVLETKAMPYNSVGMILTSIPFSTQYEYSPNYNDFGHTDSEAHFFEQMDFLTPDLLRVLKPGRVIAVHCKDRIMPGAMTGLGFQTVSRFHARVGDHLEKHGFHSAGEIVIPTDVVRENAQTYRLGWGEQCKDGSRMGVGLHEYVLLFRKAPTDPANGYADDKVQKSQKQYSRGRWQFDAHALWKTNGHRLLDPAELIRLPDDVIFKLFRARSIAAPHDFETDVRIADALDIAGKLPPTFQLLQLQTTHPNVWSDVVRMRTLNTMQASKGKEKHLCPLPFDIVDRLITRFSNADDVVYDPFGGLGTVALRAVALGRYGLACELAGGSWLDGCWYLEHEGNVLTTDMFAAVAEPNEEEAETA